MYLNYDMKGYLSFDVGIKNLAYCKLDENKVIKSWGIINLNENPECDVHLKKKCEKQSSYIVMGDDKVKYCCTAHSKKFPKKKKLNTNHDLMKISQLCVSKLRELDLDDVTHVLIENQPALKPSNEEYSNDNLYIFVMDGIMKKDSSIKLMHMVNARNKLKV